MHIRRRVAREDDSTVEKGDADIQGPIKELLQQQGKQLFPTTMGLKIILQETKSSYSDPRTTQAPQQLASGSPSSHRATEWPRRNPPSKVRVSQA